MEYDLVFRDPNRFSIEKLLEALAFWNESIIPSSHIDKGILTNSNDLVVCPVCKDKVSSKKLHLHMRQVHRWRKDKLSEELSTTWGEERLILESQNSFIIGGFYCQKIDGKWRWSERTHAPYEWAPKYLGLPMGLNDALVSWWYSLDSTCWISGIGTHYHGHPYWPSHISPDD